ncbi:response regulator transcription factor [Nonlabens sp.]|jgi:DNA-binding CsgD family transcriptional regulator|uniref:response regulator transcription factor n=1 Tax=Nonlabens sp. TaxID=1888209 RepID=UPI0039E3C786
MELSPREFESVSLLCKGKSAKMIADELCVSKRTVENQLASSRAKWKCNNAADLVRTFILQLEEPRKYFMVGLLLVIQSFAVLGVGESQERFYKNGRTVSRTVKTARRYV